MKTKPKLAIIVSVQNKY